MDLGNYLDDEFSAYLCTALMQSIENSLEDYTDIPLLEYLQDPLEDDLRIPLSNSLRLFLNNSLGGKPWI